jgi:NAD(P)-dependent dehydrogenase (short-subunit alcohol dehydrogenase family)
MALTGKVCLVTGGARGIGRAAALEMARQGAEAVLICDLNDEAGAAVVAEIEELGAASGYRRCDVSEAEQVKALMDWVGERHGRLDLLHNNAAVVDAQVGEARRLDEIDEEVWDRVFEINVKGSWLCIKYAFPLLRASKSAAIVNCASISSYAAFKGESAYCASKGAIPMLTRTAALDFAPFGIRCNCYCPGTIATEMIESEIEAVGEEAREMLAGVHLMREPRLGQPEEVAKLVCFLGSDEASFINGASYLVDGGAMAWRGYVPASGWEEAGH